MVDHLSNEKPNRNPKRLSLPWLIALVVGMCVVVALVEAEALDVASYLGGDGGVWLGLAVPFLVVGTLGAIVTRQVANPSMPLLCGILVAWGPAQAGEKIGRNLAGPVGGWLGFFLLFLVGFTLWMVLAKRIVPRRKS
jgi:hypothetical protein